MVGHLAGLGTTTVRNGLTLGADVGLLVVHGAIVALFLRRFVVHRQLPSVGVASLPLGWIFHALVDLDIVHQRPDGLFRWLGVAIGLCVVTAAYRAEVDEDKRRRRARGDTLPAVR